MDERNGDLCRASLLAEALEALASDERAGTERLAALVADHPRDPRLHFLRGSLLAGSGRYDEALGAMRRAVELDPAYAVARFQLGLLELTCGEAAAAERTLSPLLGADDGLACFAAGLLHLVRDELAAAADCLARGLERNREHPLINRDMRPIVDRISAAAGEPAPDRPASAVQALLQEYATRPMPGAR